MESDPPERSVRGVEVPTFASSSCRKFQKVQVEDSDVSSIDDQDELLPRPVRKKRPNRRYAEWSSDDEYCLRALKRSFPKYKEADSSSESESDSGRQARDAAMKPIGLPIGVVRGCPKCSDCQAVLARWRPEEGRKLSVDEAPVFYPTAEEFKDTLKYIAKIRSAAEPFGICRVVPPPGWQPPCPLRQDIAKLHVLKFPTRVQEIHKLQVRQPVKKCAQAKQRLGGRRGRGGFRGRMGRPCRRSPNLLPTRGPTKSVQQDESFGFEPGSHFSLGMFERYAQQFKEQYFFRAKETDELHGGPETKTDSVSRINPSVDAIEAEYWRIVERPTEQIEVLYGADVETGSFGSGFPKAKAGDPNTDPNSYEKSGWNLNNIARLPGSMLSFEEGEISGVLVPWLYVGMCFSSFCWHVEDHHFYSLNYLHWGAPKVWYGVAGHAAHDMEAAMKKHLPDLFDEQPDLLHKLVTQLCPSILKGEGLPVYRLVQQAGEFVITFPRAYHSGFNCGFNCAEAVNLAPVDWLPHGQGAVELYREQRRKTSVSHDKLLLAAAREAVKVILQTRGGCVEKQQENVVKQEVQKEREKTGKSGGYEEIAHSWQAFCGQDGILVKALKARVELERSGQASLAGELQMRKMDRCYDATDERECAECHYDLHLSAVGCACCPEKYVCLAHAPLLCVCQWGRKFLLYRYDLVQLELLVAALEEQPGALSTWFEHEQCSSSASSVSTQSLLSNQDSRSGPRFRLCEASISGHPVAETGFKRQDVESSLLIRSDHVISKSEILEGRGMCHQLAREAYGRPEFPLLTSGVFVNSGAEVQPRPDPEAARVNQTKIINVGFQTRGHFGLTSRANKMQNDSAEIGKQIVTTSALSHREDVIVLSDDEEVTFTTSGAEVSSVTKTHEGHADVSHALRTATLTPDSSKRALFSTQPLRAVDASFTSLERPPLFSDGLNGVLPGTLYNSGSGSPGLSLNIPTSISAGLPGMTLNMAEESRVLLSLPSRVRSVGNLKQQARAASTQHGVTLRLATTQADHLQRLQSGQELSGAELCNQLPTLDTQPPAVIQVGSAVQARTPVRLDCPAGPRVAKVLRKKVYCDVQVLNVGSIILREGWYNKRSIFPAGFKSRTSFCNVLDISQNCFYISEIVDCAQTGPRFKVSVEGNDTAAFLDDSIDTCWQAVQEQINGEIIRRRALGETNLPPLQPPQSLHGLDMFGLSTATIVQAVEALDPQHQCLGYWKEKLRNSPLPGYYSPAHTSEHRPCTPEEVYVSRPQVSGANEEVTSKPTPPVVAAMVPNGIPVDYPSRASLDLYGVLKGFFQKGKSDELWALHRLFSCDWQGKEWREGYQALTDVLDTGNPV